MPAGERVLTTELVLTMLPPSGGKCLSASWVRQDEAQDVEIEMPVEVFLGDLAEGRVFVDASVVHQDVQRAECLLHLGKEPLDVRFPGDVRLRRDGLASTAGD